MNPYIDFSYIIFVLILLFLIAYMDIRRKKIYNFLVIPLFFSGLFYQFLAFKGNSVELKWVFWVFLAYLIMFILIGIYFKKKGIWGSGDVKLLISLTPIIMGSKGVLIYFGALFAFTFILYGYYRLLLKRRRFEVPYAPCFLLAFIVMLILLK